MPRVINSHTTTYLNGVEPAPSSATTLPRMSGTIPKTPTPKPPSSMRAHSTSTMFMNNNNNNYNNQQQKEPLSPGLSRTSPSLRRNNPYPEYPTVLSDQSLQVPDRYVNLTGSSLLPITTNLSSSSSSSNNNNNISSSRGSTGFRNRAPPDRYATRSSPSLKQVMNLGQLRSKNNSNNNSSSTSNISKQQQNQQTLPQTQQDTKPKKSMLQTAKQSLRRRTYSSAYSDDETSVTGSIGGRKLKSGNGSGSGDSPYRVRGRKRAALLNQLQNLGRMKLGHILQVAIVLAVTLLVWESHHKALFAAQQLSQFKEEESLLLLHLQKIEQQSIQLHENLSRLAESGVQLPATGDEGGKQGGNGVNVDYELIHKQTQQLYHMEEELNSEVQQLQARIQRSARNHIVTEFGEGPVQVVLELDFGNGEQQQQQQQQPGQQRVNNVINILLWHDTPHAAWTWLEQINRHVWDDAHFDWQQGHILDASPQKADPSGGQIEFIEKSQHSHEAWTVGLHETEKGMMSMYINLQDNSKLHKHETCVGKVIDGFDTLQRLLEVSRNQQEGAKNTITIKQATATHVTKKEY